MRKTIPGNKAKQGRWGGRILIVLIAALTLTAISWAVAEFYGEAIESGQTQMNRPG